MTPLAQTIRKRIAATGPITLADYMAECLGHPEHGYYTTRDPLGRAGDFTTAPEISQMFGELIGLSLADAWRAAGSPAPFALVELGPGRGTLMADLRRAVARVPGFAEAAELHLVETSPRLREEQRKRHPDATWHAAVGTLPDLPLFAVANEFFDALPIRQFQRDGDGWRERVVGLSENGALALGLGAATARPELDHRHDDSSDGDIVERCAPAGAIMAEVASRIAQEGGVAILIDYGDWRSLGDTLQAVRGHAHVDPFDAPGEADLTAHVDFEALARAATEAGAAHSRLAPQGVFLERLGITPRAQALAQTLSGAALSEHVAAHRRLTHPSEMGQLFKVLGIYRAGSGPPPGLEP